MWIHEHKNWTDFVYDNEKLASKLIKVRHCQGRIIGKMESLGFELKREASLKILTNDVLKSSAIEGEKLDYEEVRSSLARRLGIDIAGLKSPSRDVEGIVEMMLDATQKFSRPLSKKRLFGWYAAIFPTGYSSMHKIIVGNWRTTESGPMQVVSGPIGRESVHFEAPTADRLDGEMNRFLSWFEDKQDIDPVLKAGIAHLWFVTIHPFEDGNGRIARAISDMALARADGIPDRFYSMSTQIELERKAYYDQLERQQRGSTEITPWLEWFLGCLERAIANSEKLLSHTLFKAKLWEKLNQKAINNRQRLIINRMLDEDFQGHMNTSKYAKLAKCSSDTALRDIQELMAHGVLIPNPGKGRSTSYSIVGEIPDDAVNR